MAERMIPRRTYLETLDGFRKNQGIVKVITGVRRSGKSELLNQFVQHLLDDGVPAERIIHMDLEQERYAIDSERMMYEIISRRIPGEGTYVLLDEVQEIRGWERVVETLRSKHGANLYITGSNSKMMSSELGTHLTGRFVEIHMFPFSFVEFVERYPIDEENGYTQRFQQYLRWGGMPVIDLEDGSTKNVSILRGVYDSIVNQDIRTRVNLDQGKLENLMRFMLSNIGNLSSKTALCDGASIDDPRTVDNYLTELCRCFIFYRSDRYDIIGRKHLNGNGKYYLVDTGFRSTVLKGSEYDEAALLENAVYIELLRRGYQVSTGSYRNKEVDFTAWKDGDPEFYQVSLTMMDEGTRKREFSSFRTMDPGNRMVVITRDRDQYDAPSGVEVVNAVDWFLGDV